jgi:hypothetical protein
MTLISKYYKLAALLPLSITTISGMILSITHDGSDYKSEWFTDDGFVLTVFFTVALSFLIALLSLTIFLNNIYPLINGSAVSSFLSWIIVPGTLCAFIIYQQLLNFSEHTRIDGSYDGNRLLDGYILTMALLHLTALVLTYLHFWSYRKTGKEKNH